MTIEQQGNAMKRPRAIVSGQEQDYQPAGEFMSLAFKEAKTDEKTKRDVVSAAIEAHRTVWQRFVRRFGYRMAGEAAVTNIIAWEARVCGIDITEAVQITWFSELEPVQRLSLVELTRKCRHESRDKSFRKNKLEQHFRTPAMRIVTDGHN